MVNLYNVKQYKFSLNYLYLFNFIIFGRYFYLRNKAEQSDQISFTTSFTRRLHFQLCSK